MRQVPWVRTRASALVTILLFALCLFMCMTPMVTYGVMLIYFAAPVMLCLAWLLAGRAAADICAVLSAAAFYLVGGLPTAAAGIVYLLPAHILFRIQTVKGASALRTGIFTASALMLSQLAVYVAVQAANGGRAYEAAALAVTQWFERDRETGDLLLIYMNSAGLLPLSPSFTGEGLTTAGALSEAARQDLLNTVHLSVVSMLTAMVPPMMVEMSIYQGAMAVLIPRRAAEGYILRRGRAGGGGDETKPLPGTDTPQLKLWHLPRGWGWRIGILGAGYILMYIPGDILSQAGQLLFYVFFAVYSIQGIALLNHIQCSRSRRRFWRIAVPILILLIFQEALCLMGCLDQVLDIRKLREPYQDDSDQREV